MATPLDWKIRLLDALLSRSKPLEEMTLTELQQAAASPMSPLQQRIFAGRRIGLPQVLDQSVPGRGGDIAIRLYYPSLEDALPLVLFFHGGGWVFGNLHTHDRLCRRLARDTGAVVVAVDYRRAPFFKYPAALEDCFDVLQWAIANPSQLRANPARLTVMGDSAGGNLAAACCLMARDQGQQAIAQQILLYPVTSGRLDQPSMATNADAPILTTSRMHRFVECYASSDEDVLAPYFSPLLAPDLTGLPPALILACELDPLYDQALAYAERLQEAGVAVTVTAYGTVHGFMSFPPFCGAARPAFRQVARFVNGVGNT